MSPWRKRLNDNADGTPRGVNRALGPIDLIGAALVVAAILLWLWRVELGIRAWWAWAFGIAGLFLSRAGDQRAGAPRAAMVDEDAWFATPAWRFTQALIGALCVGVGGYALEIGQTQIALLLAAFAFVLLGIDALWAAWRGRPSLLLRLGPFL